MDEHRIWLDRLCGVSCARSAAAGAQQLGNGLAELATSIGRFEGDDLQVAEATSDDDPCADRLADLVAERCNGKAAGQSANIQAW